MLPTRYPVMPAISWWLICSAWANHSSCRSSGRTCVNAKSTSCLSSIAEHGAPYTWYLSIRPGVPDVNEIVSRHSSVAPEGEHRIQAHRATGRYDRCDERHDGQERADGAECERAVRGHVREEVSTYRVSTLVPRASAAKPASDHMAPSRTTSEMIRIGTEGETHGDLSCAAGRSPCMSCR